MVSVAIWNHTENYSFLIESSLLAHTASIYCEVKSVAKLTPNENYSFSMES